MAKQFWQPCQLDQRVGKNHVTWNEPGKHMKKIFLSETEAGRVTEKNANTCKYRRQKKKTKKHAGAKTPAT